MKSLRTLFRDRSFAYKFTLLTTIPVVAVALCIALIASGTLGDLVTEATNVRIKRNTYLAALALSNPNLIYNKSLLDSFVDSLAHEKDILYAIIVDYTDGRILSHSDHSNDGRYYESAGPRKVQLFGTGTDGIHELPGIGYEAVSAIRIAGELFGTVRVGYNLDAVHDEIFSLKVKIAAITSVAVVFSILLSAFLARLLGKPILSLASQAQKLAEGDFDQEITYESGDVVGRLSIAFQKMTREIRERIDVIESNRKKYRALFEASNDAVFVLDGPAVIDFNQQALALFRCVAGDMTGKPFHALSPETQPDGAVSETAFRQKIEAVMNGRRIRFYWRHSRADRDEFEAEVSLSPTAISERTMILAVVQDITERKAAEERIRILNEKLEERVRERTAKLKAAIMEIRENEERFRSIASAAQSAIIMIDQSGGIQFWNRSAQTIFGWSQNETAGKDVHGLLAPEKYRAEYKKGLAGFRETGEGALLGRTVEVTAVRKDREIITIDLSITSVKLKGRLHAVGIANDITTRKRAEEALARNLEEITRFNKLAVGREKQMVRLKKEINDLLAGLGREKKYRIVE